MRCALIAILLLFTMTPLATARDIPDVIQADCLGGHVWFGLRGDGANIASAQSFTLPCCANIWEGAIYFRNTGDPHQGIPSMLSGDMIQARLLKPDGTVLAQSSAPMPFDVGDGWISFSFEGLYLEPGVYLFCAFTDVPRQASINYCSGGDYYAGGERFTSSHGGDGPWNPAPYHYDLRFRLFVCMGTVDIAHFKLGSLKSCYRFP